MDFQPMSPDEIERTMQFLLRQQAKFAADFERQSEKSDRIMEAIVGLTGIVGQLAAVQHEDRQEFRRTDARLTELGARTDARIVELAEQIARTDSHLGDLIEMFEHHLRDDHGRDPS